ncbi:MAG: DUF4352 domain-containing protein [Proteobacteria bacterium]|nr:DUF4352 domain-containing protein [Pseudomonadota bacterium]
MIKRSLALMIISMTFLIFLSVGIAGCLQGTVSVSPEPVTYQQPTKVSTSYTYSQQTPIPTTTSPLIQTFSVGESASDRDTKFTIKSFNFKDEIDSRDADKGYHFLIIDVTVENLQKDKISSLWVPYSINDADGYTYNSLYFGGLEKSFDGQNILPGETRRGNLLFSIPINSKGLKLKYNFGQGQIAVFNLQ